MERLQSQQFGKVSCDFYRDDGEIWMTRQQIGEALGYSDPYRGIAKLHSRYKDRLDSFSVVAKLTTTDGKAYNTYLYSVKGLYEICRWSQQPKADAFMDWAWDVIEHLRKGQLTPPMSTLEIIQATAAAVAAELVKQLVPVLTDLVRKAPAQAPVPSPSAHTTIIHNNIWGEESCVQHCKLETFPESIRQNVDAMLEDMLAEQNLNFSRIARYCQANGYMISSPSVKTYFKRRGIGEGV